MVSCRDARLSEIDSRHSQRHLEGRAGVRCLPPVPVRPRYECRTAVSVRVSVGRRMTEWFTSTTTRRHLFFFRFRAPFAVLRCLWGILESGLVTGHLPLVHLPPPRHLLPLQKNTIADIRPRLGFTVIGLMLVSK